MIGIAPSQPASLTDWSVSEFLTDSRALIAPDKALFFAITTPLGDGHDYVRQLFDKGVRNFVVSKMPDGFSSNDANFLIVSSPLDALQTYAAYHRSRFDIPVVAITGSRGKTTVKEWLYQTLRTDRVVARSPRSYNSQIGVPLSLLTISPQTQIAIIEAGISQPGEMERLERMIRPTVAVVTLVGSAHSEGFESFEEKKREKFKLLTNASSTVLPLSENAGEFSHSIDTNDGRTVMTFTIGSNTASVEIPFSSPVSFENVTTVIRTLGTLGLSASDIASRVADLKKVDTRLEVIEGVNDSLLIHDKFTADLSSLALALDFMSRRHTAGLKRTVVLSDFTQSNCGEDDVYAELCELLAARGIERFIGVGPEMMANKNRLPLAATVFESTDEMLSALGEDDFNSELILLKGAPEFDFQRVKELIEARQHETTLEINLDAVVDNFNLFRSKVRPTTGVVCMIKAGGYGAGSHELARTLQSQGAAYLAVAVHDEGADLRHAGITMPIMVMNPKVDNFKSLFHYRLEPEIYSIDFLRRLIREAERNGIHDYPVHIKIDSGMHRLGFTLESLPEVVETLRSQSFVVPRSIFSHLCCADEPANDEYTQSQFDYFDRCCDLLLSAFPERKILRHILNSSGICRFPERQYDMVRLGIGLYGIKTVGEELQAGLRPVSTLLTSIISLKTWEEGTTIGYNRRGTLTRRSVIATVPIGYADGLNRHLGYGNASFMVRDTLCPTVGSICMDACMLDVTDVPGVRVGDRVEIFGANRPVEILSDTLETIPYEILTSISQRVKRVYYRE